MNQANRKQAALLAEYFDSVRMFSASMFKALVMHQSKGRWDDAPLLELRQKLAVAFDKLDEHSDFVSPHIDNFKHCVDIANYAMMLGERIMSKWEAHCERQEKKNNDQTNTMDDTTNCSSGCTNTLAGIISNRMSLQLTGPMPGHYC